MLVLFAIKLLIIFAYVIYLSIYASLYIDTTNLCSSGNFVVMINVIIQSLENYAMNLVLMLSGFHI